jgi:hypothetical protein
MAIRRPLVQQSGIITELPLGDEIPADSYTAGGVTAQITVNFGNGAESVQQFVADDGVATDSLIRVQVIAPASPRELDEMEMEQFAVAAGNIVEGVGFDIIVTCLTGGGHGEYLVNYSR